MRGTVEHSTARRDAFYRRRGGRFKDCVPSSQGIPEDDFVAKRASGCAAADLAVQRLCWRFTQCALCRLLRSLTAADRLGSMGPVQRGLSFLLAAGAVLLAG